MSECKETNPSAAPNLNAEEALEGVSAPVIVEDGTLAGAPSDEAPEASAAPTTPSNPFESKNAVRDQSDSDGGQAEPPTPPIQVVDDDKDRCTAIDERSLAEQEDYRRLQEASSMCVSR